MRGVSSILLGVMSIVIIFLLAVYFLSPSKMFASGASDKIASITQGGDKGDYSSYMLVPGGTSTNCGSDVCDTDYECDNLMKAIARSALTGSPSEVDTISYGASIGSKESFPGIGACPAKDINIELAPGITQTICRFKPITSYKAVGVEPLGGISDTLSLRYGNCSIMNPKAIMLTALIMFLNNPFGSLDSNTGTVNLYYSPDYLTFENGEYPHYGESLESMANPSAFNNAYLSSGSMELYAANVKSVNGECKFDLYACPRQAIAESMTDSTIEVMKLFENLEIYNIPSIPYYMREIELSTVSVSNPHSHNQHQYEVEQDAKAYGWNFYDIKLDKPYKIETVINAIKEGLYTNVASHGYFFTHFHWDVQRDSSLSLDTETECWKSSYDDMLKNADGWYRTRSIRFNCGSNNVCSGTLRIKIGMREDFGAADLDGDGVDEQTKYISGVISVCSV